MEIIIDIPKELCISYKGRPPTIANVAPLPEPKYWVYKKGKGWFCPDCDRVGDEHFNYCPYCATPLKLKENEDND